MKITYISLDRLLLFKSQTFDRWSLIAIIDCSLNDSLWRWRATSCASFTPLSAASLVTEISPTHFLNIQKSP